jgi:C4-dicarboxylate transporter
MLANDIASAIVASASPRAGVVFVLISVLIASPFVWVKRRFLSFF